MSADAAEVKFVFRTLLRTAGLPWVFVWADPAVPADIYYGLRSAEMHAPLRIQACGQSFAAVNGREPERLREAHGLPFLEFGDHDSEPASVTATGTLFRNDIVYASHWLLTGARELTYIRDKRDNLDLSGSFFLNHSLQSRPAVSLYSSFLRLRLTELGWQPLRFPAENSFAFTHDVDYPEMIRWIECLRLAGTRGFKGIRSIAGVLRGTNHFWTFREWVDWQRTLGAKPAFYFMARQGSLMQYALGTPDDFYDVRTPKFRDLFRYLLDHGCEIGLHASYHAWRSADTLRLEKERVEEAAGTAVAGNRHHYWHLNPRAPHETLALHEKAGLLYDSSLGFEYYPGFRRGICHPFRPWHPGLRREIDVVQMPPAWMDDHYDRRLEKNMIADPVEHSRTLVRQASATGGIVVVDYHSRGMNSDFYPRYGPWIRNFVEQHLDGLRFESAGEIARRYAAYAREIESHSRDCAQVAPAAAAVDFDIAPLSAGALRDTGVLHHELFGNAEVHGHSVATFGPEFLERVFYGLNLDNPHFFCDVARYRGRVVGFSVYCTRKDVVFRHMLRHKLPGIVSGCLRLGIRRPRLVAGLLNNLRYARGERLPWTDEADGWWLVAGVHPDYRSRDFESRTGLQIAAQLFDRMEHTMQRHSCAAWYGVVRPDNPAIKKFLERRGATLLGAAPAQGLLMEYYLKRLSPETAATRDLQRAASV